MIPGRHIKTEELLKRAPAGTPKEAIPRGLRIFVANERYAKVLIREALKDIGLETKDWAKNREAVPGGFHQVEKVWRQRAAQHEPDIAIKKVDAFLPSSSIVTRSSKLLSYFQDKVPTVGYIGHIVFIPGYPLPPRMEEEPYRGKLFTKWVSNARPLDGIEAERLPEKERRNVLRQLADLFAYFHGTWEPELTESQFKHRRRGTRWYTCLSDCRLSNFLLTRNKKVVVMDPETWELRSRPPSLAGQRQDLRMLLPHAAVEGYMQNRQDLDFFVSRYLGLHLPPRKGKKVFAGIARHLANASEKEIARKLGKQGPLAWA